MWFDLKPLRCVCDNVAMTTVQENSFCCASYWCHMLGAEWTCLDMAQRVCVRVCALYPILGGESSGMCTQIHWDMHSIYTRFVLTKPLESKMSLKKRFSFRKARHQKTVSMPENLSIWVFFFARLFFIGLTLLDQLLYSLVASLAAVLVSLDWPQQGFKQAVRRRSV